MNVFFRIICPFSPFAHSFRRKKPVTRRDDIRDVTKKAKQNKTTSLQGSLEIEECDSATMMEGLKKRTRKAFGIRKKEKDTDSTGSPDRDGIHPSPHEPPYNSKAEYAREGGKKVSKKSNGAPNGFYAEIDWERYNSPELDEEGYSIRPEEPGSTKGKHFYSSSESEEEEESHKKFNIKIKPLQSKDVLKSAATVDELKASIGNIALSPSPVRKSPVSVLSSFLLITEAQPGEEVARPRRSTPTPELVSKKAPEDPVALAPLFGPPLESTFEEQKSEVPLDQPEIWGSVQPVNASLESPKLTRPFPTGTPPPLPPKNVPATPPRTGSPLTVGPGSEQTTHEVKGDKLPSISDLDSIFGPVLSPKSVVVNTEEKWVNFSDASPERVTPELTSREKVASPPPVSENPADIPAGDPPRNIPSPLDLEEVQKKFSEQTLGKDDYLETVASPKDLGLGQRATPPPPPPPTYRTVVSSPGPSSGSGTGTASGASSPARPATPSAHCSSGTTPPPPPPRPPSRPKLPPGKPGVGDVSRPFSPPIHSSSPPPIAPLARAESTSSISSTNSLSAATTPTVENEQPSLVWFDRGKFYLTFEGSSRGPSPLTMGAQDTLPVAAAFTETVNAYFKGADPSKCIVKITGEMVLSFPAGITRHFANNPSPATLTFRVVNFNSDDAQSDANTKEFWVNMPNLMTHLKKVSEQKPQATYYNVDMLKYQVSAQGIQSTPLNLAVNWRCEPASTDLRIDYKYNTDAMTTPVALNNVQFLIPIDGGVTKLQAVLPPAVWNAEQQRILWKIPDISQKSENGGVGSLLARFQLSEGPSKPSPLVVQFTSEGSTLSGCDIELVGAGYRFSLIKKRFAAGKYLADN
ncbi:SH3-containing GRB2-like protein 3-interacting protein 1 isoform X3 [Monodelphis domestica]|uniref:SH3-containing GRB2-like protein 3-interacting protein 1 isoform X3 n=1 Tax=Monodelphis domestica TaxID=13616 RepID=UPI0024E1C7D0|nr:SH3-containing GRB2-like protein 3-interacting protein 1 isoform X3 [Monodelphis domestica]